MSKPASPKQVSFLTSIYTTLQTNQADLTPEDFNTLAKHETTLTAVLGGVEVAMSLVSSAIDALMPISGRFSPASDKQVSFITSLAEQTGFDLSTVTINRQTASGLITMLKGLPKVAKAAPVKADAPVGVHLFEGNLYRVKTSRTSGKRYALGINAAGTKLTEYLPGFIRNLSDETVVDAATAAAFGHSTGWCCFCANELEDKRSTDAGYGPVCAKKYGLPWGVKAPQVDTVEEAPMFEAIGMITVDTEVFS